MSDAAAVVALLNEAEVRLASIRWDERAAIPSNPVESVGLVVREAEAKIEEAKKLLPECERLRTFVEMLAQPDPVEKRGGMPMWYTKRAREALGYKHSANEDETAYESDEPMEAQSVPYEGMDS